MPIRLLTVIGARPQIIKAAAISRALQGVFCGPIVEKILHTGQHYDENMSGAFFAELGIPQPDYNLHVGSGSHGSQTAKMIEGIEEVLQKEHFDGIILYGDTNSTLAGAVAAAKLHVPIFHVEAGLRSFNMAMPEEQNRIVCDHLSSILFAPTQTALDNLFQEGLYYSQAVFKNKRERNVVLSGDVMYDNSMYFASMAEQRSTILNDLNLTPKQFILATIHRDNNTDDPHRLNNIVSAMLSIVSRDKMPIVLPLHPRTRKMLPQSLTSDNYNRLLNSEYIKITDPASFFDIIMLEKNARIVMTDSGGVQKEAFFYGTPTIILRPQTEWVEIIDAKAGVLADADYVKILEAYMDLLDRQVDFPPLFGDAHAAEHILVEIIQYLY